MAPLRELYFNVENAVPASLCFSFYCVYSGWVDFSYLSFEQLDWSICKG